jgi:hypothetical protein
MTRFIAPLLTVLLATSAAADENTTAARDFMILCAKRLPETRQTVQVLKDQGWRYESTDGTYHFYSENGRRVIAATSVTSSPDQGCLASVSKLKKAGAVALAKVVAQELGLAEANKGLPADVYGAWSGRLNGTQVVLVALPPADFGVMRGAALVLMQQ